MPSTYYTASDGQKKALPVSHHSHTLDRTNLRDVAVSADGSVTDPRGGSVLAWVGNPPTSPNPGKWYAGDAPVRAPVQETVLANWFEPNSWTPPGADNPDGAVGTWRKSAGTGILSWEGPQGGNGKPPFGIASETVDGYVRLQTASSLTVQWGREVNSGARPIAYGAAGFQASAEYVYKITVLAMALGPKTGATGPWKLSVGMAFFKDNKIFSSTGIAPTAASTPIVWGANQIEIDKIGSAGTEQWVVVDCWMSGRVASTDLPSDAPVGESLGWNHERPDGPHDGYYFCPVIKVDGAGADVLIDSVQVLRAQHTILVPGGVQTTTVSANTVDTERASVTRLVLQQRTSVQDRLFPATAVTEKNDNGQSTWYTNAYGYGFAWPQPWPTINTSGIFFTPNRNPEQGAGTDAKFVGGADPADYRRACPLIRPGRSYKIEAIVTGTKVGQLFAFGFGFVGPFDPPALAVDGTPQSYSATWNVPTDYNGGVPGRERLHFWVGRPGSYGSPGNGWADTGDFTVSYLQLTETIYNAPGEIIGLGDPVLAGDPVTLGYLQSLKLGDKAKAVYFAPTTPGQEPPEPEDPYEAGTLWVNPNATSDLGWRYTFLPTGAVSEFYPTYVDTAHTGYTWVDVPNWKRLVLRAPGAGEFEIEGDVSCYVPADRHIMTRIGVEGTVSAEGWSASRIDKGHFGCNVPAEHMQRPRTRLLFEGPATVIVKFQTAGTGTTGYTGTKVGNPLMHVTWTPASRVEWVGYNATDAQDGRMAGLTSEKQLRVWNGENWMPAQPSLSPGFEQIAASLTIVPVTTTTSISGGGVQNGGYRTITATVTGTSGTPTGSVQFLRDGTVIHTATLSGGTVSMGVNSSGNYSAKYLGAVSGAYDFKASTSGSTGVTIRQLYEGQWGQGAKWNVTFNGTGAVRTDNTQYAYEGYYSSNQGNLTSAVGFDRLNVANLHDVTYVALQLACAHSYNGAGKDCDIGWHNAGPGAPGHLTHFGRSENHQGVWIGKGATQFFDITSWAAGVVSRGDFGGIFLGSGAAANQAHYGYFHDGSMWLHINYRYWA